MNKKDLLENYLYKLYKIYQEKNCSRTGTRSAIKLIFLLTQY